MARDFAGFLQFFDALAGAEALSVSACFVRSYIAQQQWVGCQGRRERDFAVSVSPHAVPGFFLKLFN